MNKPVGIPSGWEEKAAYIWASAPSYFGKLHWLASFCTSWCEAWNYVSCEHDWRVED